MGNSRRYFPPTLCTTARSRPSGDQSASKTFSSSSRGAPPSSGTRASVPVLIQVRLAADGDRELPGGGDSQDPGVRQLQAARLDAAGARREDPERLSLPSGGIDDRLAVGGEPRPDNRAATEGEAFVRRRRGLLSDRVEAPAGEKPESRAARLPGAACARSAKAPHRALRPSAAPETRGQRLEVEREVAGGLEPPLGVLLEAVAHDPLEARDDVLVGDGEVRRVLLQDRRHRLAGRVAAERALAREHLVEDRAEREDVAPRVGGLAP